MGVALILAIQTAPAWMLACRALPWIVSSGSFLETSFSKVLPSSLLTGLLVAVASLGIGLPAGVLFALEALPMRRWLLALTTVPLLVPSFLWALGWSEFAAMLGPRVTNALTGLLGVTLIFGPSVAPLVVLVAYRAASTLSGSQLDAARLAGGETTALLYTLRHAALPSLIAALLGAALTVSDPGPGQVFGFRSAASEILTSFSARNDFELAARQSLALAIVVFLVTAPVVFLAAPRLAVEILAQQTRTLQRVREPIYAGLGVGLFSVLILTGIAVPICGIGGPLLRGGSFMRAFEVASRTGIDTLCYASGAGAIAVALGFGLAFFVGRERKLRIVSVAAAIAVFSLPATLGALGIVELGTQAPAWADTLLRSRGTVCASLGIRYSSVAVLLGLRAWGTMPQSWSLAASIHSVPPAKFLARVVFPHLVPSITAAFFCVALLATADVTTVLLLHPPGQSSYPLSVFTVMANAPESLVASLCVLYIAAAAAMIAAVVLIFQASEYLRTKHAHGQDSV